MIRSTYEYVVSCNVSHRYLSSHLKYWQVENNRRLYEFISFSFIEFFTTEE